MADPDNKPPGNVVVVPVGPAMLLPGEVIPARGHIFLDGSGVGLTDIAKALQSHEEAVAEAIAAIAAKVGQAPPTVHSQITDAITQVNTKVLGDAPAMPMGNLYQATAQALANAANNATAAQQQADTPAQAVSPRETEKGSG
jgi:fructose-specific component phosphotransferase system IIB-like protein